MAWPRASERFEQSGPACASTVFGREWGCTKSPFLLLLTATANRDAVTSSDRVSLAGCVAQRQPQPPPLLCTESITLSRQEALRGPFSLNNNAHIQFQRPQSSCVVCVCLLLKASRGHHVEGFTAYTGPPDVPEAGSRPQRDGLVRLRALASPLPPPQVGPGMLDFDRSRCGCDFIMSFYESRDFSPPSICMQLLWNKTIIDKHQWPCLDLWTVCTLFVLSGR